MLVLMQLFFKKTHYPSLASSRALKARKTRVTIDRQIGALQLAHNRWRDGIEQLLAFNKLRVEHVVADQCLQPIELPTPDVVVPVNSRDLNGNR